MVHVFVDRETRRPLPGGMPERVRRGLEALTVKNDGDGALMVKGDGAMEQRAKSTSKL